MCSAGQASRGETVSIADVNKAEGKIQYLPIEEIEQQIKKSDALFCSAKNDKDRFYNKGIYRGLQIAVQLAEKI